jgi:hypothetical protein
MPIDWSNNARQLTAKDFGGYDLMDALTKGQKFGQNQQMFPEQMKEAQLLNSIKNIQAKYAEQNAIEALKKSQLENKWYEPDVRSQIGLRGAQTGEANARIPYINAQTDVERLKAQYPGLGSTGAVGNLAYAQYLSQNPKIAQALKAQGGQGEEQNQENGFSNPIQYLQESAQNDINYKKALTTSMQKNITSRPFERMPAADKAYALAQARGFGLTGEEASAFLQGGGTLRQLAESKGYKANDMTSWPMAQGAPTTAMQTRIQRANTTLAGLKAVEKDIKQAYSQYAPRFKGVSPALIKDMVKGENIDKQADIFSVLMVGPEVNALRINALGGNVGIGALKHMEDLAYQRLNTFGLSPDSDVYKKTLDKANRMIEKMNMAENKALYQQQQKSYALEDQNEEPSINDVEAEMARRGLIND